MDLKSKIKSFVDKNKKNISVKTNQNEKEEFEWKNEFAEKSAALFQQRKEILLDDYRLTPEAEEAVIESIEQIYFEQSIDVGDHELKKFPDIGDIHVINGIRSRLRKQQAVVNRCVSNIILKQQDLYTQEMKKIFEIQKELCMCINLCSNSRSALKSGRSQFTAASLGILSNYYKRQKILEVMDSLKTIRTLQMTDIELKNLLDLEDYPGAINLILEGQKVASTFEHFTCISELNVKLKDTLDTLESNLESAISKVSLNFNPVLYQKLFIAYNLFNKGQIMLDHLHMCLTSHIHNTAFNIILGYVELYNDNSANINSGDSSPVYSKLNYSDLCSYINQECFISCLIDLNKGLWNILTNYKNIIKWHDLNEDLAEDSNCKSSYVKQKLEHGLIRLWQDVQAKVRRYILATDLSKFQIDDFLKILNIINKLIEVGESFCNSQSESLQDSIKMQSFNFFQSYHSSTMEELHMILENEGWEICPVKKSFSVHLFTEYKFLKVNLKSKSSTPMSSPKKECKATSKNLFELFENDTTPFDLTTDDILEEDFIINSTNEFSGDESEEELKKDYIEELNQNEKNVCRRKKSKELHRAPIVTNTTLTIFRLIGKYFQMMKLLHSIAFDVLLCLTQLYEYYLIAIFVLFAQRSTLDQNLSPQLRATLKKIEDVLVKVPLPSSHNIQSDDTLATMYGLPIKVIACESLNFLGLELENLRDQIECIIPSNKVNFLHQFFDDTVACSFEIQQHILHTIALKVVNYDDLIAQMSAVKWDLKELKDHHNAYIDFLLAQLQNISHRLEDLRIEHRIPDTSCDILWKCVIKSVNGALTEGFSTAKKCSNEGRSLMLLDFQQFLMKVEKITTTKPLPDKHLVDSFIKAYYLPDDEGENGILNWVTLNQNSYTSKQITNLVNCMTQVSKKSRQKISVYVNSED